VQEEKACPREAEKEEVEERHLTKDGYRRPSLMNLPEREDQMSIVGKADSHKLKRKGSYPFIRRLRPGRKGTRSPGMVKDGTRLGGDGSRLTWFKRVILVVRGRNRKGG